MAKRTLNPMTETPQNKVDITKSFMEAYMKSEKATKADLDWYISIIEKPENRKTYKSSLTGKSYEDIDVGKVRSLFCDRFYPNLNSSTSKKMSFTDRIKDIKK